MNCDRYRVMMTAYLDGELSAREERAFEEHLSGCPRCREELDGIRRLLECAARAQTPGPSRDLWNDVRRRISEPRLVPFHALRRLGLAAAAAAVLFVGVWAAHHLRQPREGSPEISQVLGSVMGAAGWKGVYGATVGLELSGVEGGNVAAASILPLPSPENGEVRISYRAADAAAFLNGLLAPASYKNLAEGIHEGENCWVLWQPQRELWISKERNVPVKLRLETPLGGEIVFDRISYRRQQGFLVPDHLNLVLRVPGGEQGLELGIALKDVNLLR